jgi:hypothetical protein
MKSRAACGWTGIPAVILRNSAMSIRLRGEQTAVIRAIGLPRRAMHMASGSALDQRAQMRLCVGETNRDHPETPD